jgi:hypothetical protein
MTMPGRKFTQSNSNYRYGYNKQERSIDINENLFTAKYWEYDSRIGRRWNLDPIYNTDISRYAVNANNPNYYLDPNGDFRTKFGAKWHKFWHREKGDVKQNNTEGSKRFGEWYIERAPGEGKKGDGKENLDEVVINAPIYGRNGGKSSKRAIGDPWHQDWLPFPFGSSPDDPAKKAQEVLDYLQKNGKEIWNSSFMRNIIPDYYTLSIGGSSASGITGGEEITFTLMLRGKDPGLYFNSTTNMGWVTSVGVDVGASIGKGRFLGDARNLSSSMLGGWQASGNLGFGIKAIAGGSVNAGVDVGFDDKGNPTTITGKAGISVGLGVSTPILQGGMNAGKATNAIPIIKF